MPPPSTLDVPSPEEVRRFFADRGDVSLGLVPQVLLPAERADLWGYFWYAARIIDDEIESGQATTEEYLQRIRRGQQDRLAERCLTYVLSHLPPAIHAAGLRRQMEQAILALGREQQFVQPPRLAEYAEVVRDKAGIPLTFLNRLLLEGEPEESVRRFSVLLGFSIQLGDDLRDRPSDAARGIHAISREEIELAGADHLGTADEAPMAIQKWREMAAYRFALLALQRADAFHNKANRRAARLETQLWLRTIASGQLQASEFPVRWPHPIGEMLTLGIPTAGHLAMLREALYGDRRVVGDTGRWDPPGRAEELQRLKSQLPPLYATLEAVAGS